MEAMEAIKTRRSVRGFMNENVSDEVVGQILEAGRWAPSGLNNQAWRFIVVRNEEMAVVAFGHPVKKERYSDRKELSELAFRERFGAAW
jgi:nitroreductase